MSSFTPEYDCPFSLGKDKEKCCYACGIPLSGRRTRWCSAECCKAFYENHDWNMARKKARRRGKYACRKCGSNEKIEVNHIVPLNGRKRSTLSCFNHGANLEVLCRVHHHEETARQRKEGLLNGLS